MNFTINPITILLIIQSVAIIILIAVVINLYMKLKKFLIGASSTNLDDSMISIANSLKDFEKFRNELEAYLLNVEKRLKKSVQAVNTIRFNPFQGTGSGGNQSFVTTLLNEERDGVIISSLYSRDHVSIFAKSVKGGVSQFELSEEEKRSLEEAKTSLSNNK
jgi:hypothetical protein